MGKSKKNPFPISSASLIKGYLPVRLKVPNFSNATSETGEETFFYVKEHREGKSTESANDSSSTLFVANAPFVPGIQSRLLLKALFGRFGDIKRVTVIDNLARPDKDKLNAPCTSVVPWTTSDWTSKFPTFFRPNPPSGKFAHVVFTSTQHMRQALRALAKSMIMSTQTGERSGIELTKLECQVLKDTADRTTHPQFTESDNDDDDNIFDNGNRKFPSSSKSPTSGLLSVAQRYRESLASLSDRNALLEECNAVMQSYEDAEDAQHLAREAAANQPDDDGFVTVTSNSVGVGKQELEHDGGKQSCGRRRNAKKRDRKKKDNTGASELKDFYRFQRKETRKRTLQDLRKHFEEDLEKVKKMKEDRRYQPFYS